MTSAKAVDVNKLLKKHFGEEWSNREYLVFYKNAIAKTVECNNDDNMFECLCQPEASTSFVQVLYLLLKVLLPLYHGVYVQACEQCCYS